MTHRALAEQLSGLDPADQQYASQFIDLMIAWARERGASDIHLQPTADGLEARFRVDGVLNTLGTFAAGDSTNIVTRLKVMAELLTYRSDVPQEGRLVGSQCRVSGRDLVAGQVRPEARGRASCDSNRTDRRPHGSPCGAVSGDIGQRSIDSIAEK